METRKSTDRVKRGLSLLSLDGGGIRGLSELIIIEELMERLKSREKLDKVPLPADRFDLIGGTSTGGLIAILLGRLRLSAADAIKAYESLAGKVFSQKKTKGKDGTFKASKLEEAIKGVIKDTLGHEHTNARMYQEGEGGSDGCLAFVCAVGTPDVTHAAGPTLFRSYDVAKNKEYNCAIWEAARATSAAPTLFKRIKIGPPGSGIEYVDAGIGCNNPVKQLIAEAARVFGEDARIACIVSIGTGQSGSVGLAKPDAFQKWLPVDLVKVLKEIATDSGRVAEEMEQKYKNVPGLYNRFDVDRGLQSVSLDEWKRLGDVRAYTKNYMRLDVNDRRVDNVVGVLNGSFSHHTCTAGELTGSVQCKAHTPLRINVPQSRVSHFVDRPTMLKEISGRFLHRTSEEIVVLVGMGGSGKTQLALEFCRQAEENLGFMAVMWINASSPVSVVQSYKAIAKKISEIQQEDASSEDVVPLVQDTLREWKHPWLLVFDNYDNPTAFQTSSIRHYIPKAKEGRILFTSRHEDSARLGHKIEVADMTKNESLEVLLQRLPLNDEEAFHGREVAATLGYLALALDQAGSYIRARNMMLRDFIPHYHRRKEVIMKAIPDEWEYRRSISDEEKETSLKIFTTWELSFEQIGGDEKEIQQKDHFLSLAAFFDVRAVSERYFVSHFNAESPDWMQIFSSEGGWDSDKLGDVLAELNNLSLLQIPKHAVDKQFFSIHPVVRDWIQLRKSHEKQQQFVEELNSTLASYLKNYDWDYMSLETKQETLLHIDSCVGHNKKLLSESSNRSLDDLWDAASWFAYFYGEQGRYEEAEKLYERVLTGREKSLGATHPDTLETMQELAVVYIYQGRYVEAEKLYERALIENDNENSPKKKHNLALLYGRQGRFDEAERLYERILIDSEKRPGAMHPDTLITMQNLADLYRCQGRYDDAERLLERALMGYEEKLEGTHPDTLRSMRNLAEVYRCQGRYDDAERLLEPALMGSEEKLGATHPDTLDAVYTLANVYLYQGRYDEAERLFKRALTSKERELGVMEGLAALCLRQGRYDEAEQLLKRALIGNEEKLGATHPKTLRTVYNSGCAYANQGRYDEAKKLCEQALSGQKDRLGVKHPDTLLTVESLANLCRDQGQDDEAEKLVQEFDLS